MTRRYLLVHTHPENLVLGPRNVAWLRSNPLMLVDPIEFDRFSLQRETFTNPRYCHDPAAIAAALADPETEVICLCLRTSDRHGEAKKLGMTVIEVQDAGEANLRMQDKLPRVEWLTYTDDDGRESAPSQVTHWEARPEAAD